MTGEGSLSDGMLPVQTWDEWEQEAEATEFGDQARDAGIGGDEIRVRSSR